MQALVAPSALFAVFALFVVAMPGLRRGPGRTAGTWQFLFATCVVVLIAGAAFMTNWLVFIDPPDYCWKARDGAVAVRLHALAWEDCRMHITVTALSLDAVIAGAMAMSLMTSRKR